MQLEPCDQTEVALITRVTLETAKASNRFEKELAQLIAGLSLPLADSLDVPPEEVPSKAQEILEAVIRLRQQRDAVFEQARTSIESHINSFPDVEKKKIRKRIDDVVVIV